jgi:hypothetical protein
MMRSFVWTAWIGLALTTLVASPVLAQTTCDGEADSDADGFSDLAECNGITLREGLTFVATGTRLVPSCLVETELEPAFCLDPARQDLFVIIVRSEPTSGLPEDILSFTTASASEGGLGVSVHVLSEDPQGDRTVSDVSAQKAVRITESRDTPGDKLGLANYGSPNGLDGSTIWTARIEEFVASECPNDACQVDNGAAGRENVTEALIRWVLNHEVGHLFALTADYNKRFGGYHLKAGTDSVMAQFVGYSTSKKTKITTLFIPQTFDAQSQADALLAAP